MILLSFLLCRPQNVPGALPKHVQHEMETRSKEAEAQTVQDAMPQRPPMRAAAAAANRKIMHRGPEPIVADVAEADTEREEGMQVTAPSEQALGPKKLQKQSTARATHTEDSDDASLMDHSLEEGSESEEDEAEDIQRLEAIYAKRRASRAAAATNADDVESRSRMVVSFEAVSADAGEEPQPAPQKADSPRRRRTRAAAAAAEQKAKILAANSRDLASKANALKRKTAREESKKRSGDTLMREVSDNDCDAAMWDITGSRLEVQRVCGRVEGKPGVFSVQLVGECQSRVAVSVNLRD